METSYFDPVLWHNNKQKAYEGYCSDIFTNNAIDFIEKNQDQPFFCYLSFNAPNTPLQVPDKYYQMYKDIDPNKGIDPKLLPAADMTKESDEDARKVYSMVTNIDDNLNQLFQKLEVLGIEENTIVIFMTDNGPQQARFVGYARRKSSVYREVFEFPFLCVIPLNLVGIRNGSDGCPYRPTTYTLSIMWSSASPRQRDRWKKFCFCARGPRFIRTKFFPIGQGSFPKSTIT